MNGNPFVLSLLVLAGAVVLTLLTGHTVRSFNAERYAWQRRVRGWLGISTGRRMGELWWAGWLLHFAVWSVAIYLLLQAWNLVDLANSATETVLRAGVMIDGVHVVPVRVVIGTLWFLLMVTLARWINRKVANEWLTRARIEPSTRESVGTLLGYATFVVALLTALHAAGVNLDRLAVVAGALSVGVGFGLQNIVSNFVSGVILLFEQPIRSGDYISVGETAGFVRKIRIRATEIETWDRESIILPNSMLLSTPVKNLNLRDDYGRIMIRLGVAYGTDVELVRTLLLAAAGAHPRTVKEGEHLTIPGPRVMFADFGESALQFELRVFISPITGSLFVSSDLRFAIEKSFRENHIVMPFPQRDVHVRVTPQEAPGLGVAGAGPG